MFRNQFWTWIWERNQTGSMIFWFQFFILSRALHLLLLLGMKLFHWFIPCQNPALRRFNTTLNFWKFKVVLNLLLQFFFNFAKSCILHQTANHSLARMVLSLLKQLAGKLFILFGPVRSNNFLVKQTTLYSGYGFIWWTASFTFFNNWGLGGEAKSAHEPSGPSGWLLPWFIAWSDLKNLYFPLLDCMLVHHRVTLGGERTTKLTRLVESTSKVF